MANHRCFLLCSAGRMARWLRRYTSALDIGVRLCEPVGMHEAYHRIEDGPLIRHKDGTISTEPLDWNEFDPRWPAKCAHCPYDWPGLKGGQLFYLEIFLAPNGDEHVTVNMPPPESRRAPPGALWYDDYLAEGCGCKGPDGRCLSVMTECGCWCIDGADSDGKRPWKRQGTVPKVSVDRSIVFRDQGRSFTIQAGVLIEL